MAANVSLREFLVSGRPRCERAEWHRGRVVGSKRQTARPAGPRAPRRLQARSPALLRDRRSEQLSQRPAGTENGPLFLSRFSRVESGRRQLLAAKRLVYAKRAGRGRRV